MFKHPEMPFELFNADGKAPEILNAEKDRLLNIGGKDFPKERTNSCNHEDDGHGKSAKVGQLDLTLEEASILTPCQ